MRGGEGGFKVRGHETQPECCDVVCVVWDGGGSGNEERMGVVATQLGLAMLKRVGSASGKWRWGREAFKRSMTGCVVKVRYAKSTSLTVAFCHVPLGLLGVARVV